MSEITLSVPTPAVNDMCPDCGHPISSAWNESERCEQLHCEACWWGRLSNDPQDRPENQTMTVAELRALLADMPSDAVIQVVDSEGEWDVLSVHRDGSEIVFIDVTG